MSSNFKRILYGGDYNPNQWPKEVWKEDMRIFKDAHINTATINVFSWAKIQPSEHEYYFDELDEIVDMLSKENYDIVFATSTAALPGCANIRRLCLRTMRDDATNSACAIMPARIHSCSSIMRVNWHTSLRSVMQIILM